MLCGNDTNGPFISDLEEGSTLVGRSFERNRDVFTNKLPNGGLGVKEARVPPSRSGAVSTTDKT